MGTLDAVRTRALTLLEDSFTPGVETLNMAFSLAQ